MSGVRSPQRPKTTALRWFFNEAPRGAERERPSAYIASMAGQEIEYWRGSPAHHEAIFFSFPQQAIFPGPRAAEFSDFLDRAARLGGRHLDAERRPGLARPRDHRLGRQAQRGQRRPIPAHDG